VVLQTTIVLIKLLTLCSSRHPSW